MSRFFMHHARYGGQLFDVPDELEADLKADLYPLGWRDSPKAAREAAQPVSAPQAPAQAPELDPAPEVPDLATASDRALEALSRGTLERAAREQLGIELDRRKKPENLVRDIREAQSGHRW